MELQNAALGPGGEATPPYSAPPRWELPERGGLNEACGGLLIRVAAFVSSHSPSVGFSSECVHKVHCTCENKLTARRQMVPTSNVALQQRMCVAEVHPEEGCLLFCCHYGDPSLILE